MHIGTNLTDPNAYELAAERLAALACKAEQQLGHGLNYIDVGGGFSACSNAIPLGVHPDEWIPVSIAEVSTRIAAVLDRVDPEKRWSIVVEPGRVLAESAMVLLSRVVSVKKRRGCRLAIIDAGTNILPTAYYTHHPLTFPGKKMSSTDLAADFYGPLCTQYDMIATEVKAPELVARNLVLIHSTGAYAWAFSSQFVGPRHLVDYFKGYTLQQFAWQSVVIG